VAFWSKSPATTSASKQASLLKQDILLSVCFHNSSCLRSLSSVIKHMNSLHTFDFSGDTKCASKNIKECQVWKMGKGRNAHLWTNQPKFSVTLTDMVQHNYIATTCFVRPRESSKWVVAHLVGNANQMRWLLMKQHSMFTEKDKQVERWIMLEYHMWTLWQLVKPFCINWASSKKLCLTLPNFSTIQ
jgi:hypothetical protein